MMRTSEHFLSLGQSMEFSCVADDEGKSDLGKCILPTLANAQYSRPPWQPWCGAWARCQEAQKNKSNSSRFCVAANSKMLEEQFGSFTMMAVDI